MRLALTMGILVALTAAPLLAQLDWNDLSSVQNNGAAPIQAQYDQAEFDQILRQEQLLFTDQARYHQRPLRQFERRYPRHFRVVDSWFDIFWDTPSFSTNRSDGAALITFMFRDIVSFQPTGGRSFFSITDFMNVGLRRWHGSRQAYPVYGFWGLQDFSRRNHDLVKKHMSNVAAFSFHQYYHAYSRNDHSRAFTFRRIIHFIDYYKLPVLCLLPNTNETVLIYKVVIRDDGQAAMFYYRPRDDAFYRRANEEYMKNVVFVRMEGGQVRFFNNARYDNRAYRFYGGVDDVLIIDNLAQIYAEVAPMMRMSGVIADITGKGDPIRGGFAIGSVIGTLINPGSGDQKAANIAGILLGQTPATLGPSQVMHIPPPTSQTLQWPREYPNGIDPRYLPPGKNGMDYGQYEQTYGQIDTYVPGQYAGQDLFPDGKYPVPGSPNYPGGQLPPWVIQEKPGTFDLSAFIRVPWHDDKGGQWHDPRLPPRDHALPPERFYPGDKGSSPPDPGQIGLPPNPGQIGFPPNPGQIGFPPCPPPFKPPVYLPPPPIMPPHVPRPPICLPPRPPIVIRPPRPPRPPVYVPPRPPRPPRPPKPPKPPVFVPPPPPPPKPPRPPKPPKPPTQWPAHCNREYPHRSTKGHLFTGKRAGTGPGKFKLIGECYDDQYYNRYGYDEDGYDRDGYDPWGEDRRGYDRKGYDPWGYDRRGEDPAGDKCHDTRLNKFRALYHGAPLKFRKKYAIGKRSGKIVRRKDRRVLWAGEAAIGVSRPFRGNTDKGSTTVTYTTREHGNIDKSRSYQTNDKGHVIQYTPPGGATGGQQGQQTTVTPSAPQQTQTNQSGQSSMFTAPAADPGVKGNTVTAPLNQRKYRTYHRK